MATRRPTEVTPGTGLGYITASSGPVGQLTQVPPSGAQPGAFQVPPAPRAATMTASTSSTRFIEIDYNGNIIVSAVTSMNFTGAGVIVSNVGSAVTINIPGSNGTPTGPNNSLQFNSLGTLAGNANLTFDPSTKILTVTGNVHANYFVGDGTRLSNITGANIIGQIPFAAASNTANTAISAVTAGTVTTAAQPAITSVGTLTSVAATGNITTTGLISATGNITATGNLRGGNIGTLGLIFATGNIFAQGNLGTAGLMFATGNITGSNLIASGSVTATGNITGAYLVGDGSQITNLPAGNYNNANVTTLLASFGSNVISSTGNITSTANVAGGNLKTTGLISATGDITGGNVNAGALIVATSHTGATFSATGNITGGNIVTAGQITGTGNVQGGNLRTTGQVTATGNITGNYILGNGSQLTGIAGSYGNSQVTDFLPTYTGNLVSLTGPVTTTSNISGGNIITAGAITATGNITVISGVFTGNGAGLTGVIAAGNVGSASQLANGTSSFNIPVANGNVVGNIGGVTNVFTFATTGVTVTGLVSATGNITGNYFVGNGSQLTGIVAGGSGNVSGPASSTDNAVARYDSTTGQLLQNSSVTISDTGAITAPGVSSVIPFYYANQAAFPSATTYHGALAHSHADGAMYFAHNGVWTKLLDALNAVSTSANITGGNLLTGGLISATGNINGNFFVGNGSALTGIVANTSYGNSNVVTLLAGFGSNTVSTTGNVTAGNFIGNVVGGGAGTPTISSATNLDLSAVSAVRVIGGGTFRLPSLTTAQIANVTAANGDMIYNSSVNKFQGYENGAWANII